MSADQISGDLRQPTEVGRMSKTAPAYLAVEGLWYGVHTQVGVKDGLIAMSG